MVARLVHAAPSNRMTFPPLLTAAQKLVAGHDTEVRRLPGKLARVAQVLPSKDRTWPTSVTAAQKVAVGHETASTLSSVMASGVDHVVPL